MQDITDFGEFAAGLAHEIKNPLAGILGVIEIFGQDLPAESPLREVWQDVRQELHRIEDILNDLSEYARPKPLELRDASLAEAIEKAIESAKRKVLDKTTDKAIQFKLAVEPRLPLVQHDPAQMQQAILSLLLNSIYAIGREGTVEIQIQLGGTSVAIHVIDHGRSLDPSQVANVFRPFLSTRRKRTGLELAIVKQVILAHHGRMEASSNATEGTRFSLHLPISQPDARTVATKSLES